ncbi:hypothetical protein CHS0354_003309 [Potamilus streckersoni]|uniref:Uncharacterized protein n=1 Tax=Potamilus streckersoni TaxID=2493646 RepID=A0AAE0S538_9BIVA|nr:hypothetical protein CHS0354_003309 [Potamilus streckersoni]
MVDNSEGNHGEMVDNSEGNYKTLFGPTVPLLIAHSVIDRAMTGSRRTDGEILSTMLHSDTAITSSSSKHISMDIFVIYVKLKETQEHQIPA